MTPLTKTQIEAMLAGAPETTAALYDDRTRPILFQQASTRGAHDWRHEDAEAVIALLLAKLDRQPDLARTAIALHDRVAELEGALRYIIKQWPDTFAARTARATLERTTP